MLGHNVGEFTHKKIRASYYNKQKEKKQKKK